MSLFSGLSAFPLTPASSDGVVDTDALAALVGEVASAGVDSLGVLGSTGAYMYLDRMQRRRAIAAAVEAAGSTPVMAGVGALRTDEVQALAQDAADAGAAGLLLAPVSYTPLTEEEVYRHFVAVASVTSLPICIYNNPGTTHFTFSRALIARLAELPTVAGIKMPLPADGDFAGELAALREAAPGLSIGYSADWGLKDALLAGADAFYSVAAGMFPARTVALAAAARAGQAAEADRLDAAYAPLWALFRQFGGLRTMYAAVALLGRSQARPPLPILPIEGEALDRVAAAIQDL